MASAPPPPPHIADSVRSVRRHVLRGRRSSSHTSSRCSSNGTRSPAAAWRLAEELGATVSNSIGPHVTHVVAGSDGTDKVRWGQCQPGVHVVSVEWLASCGYSWRAVRESSMPVASGGPSGQDLSKRGQLRGVIPKRGRAKRHLATSTTGVIWVMRALQSLESQIHPRGSG